MSIQKLMSDQKAAAIYASLDTHIHPAVLADYYLQAKLAGNTSLCLALECFIRDLARMHFNRPEVLEALASMERHKKRRKMGKGAPRMLQDIAAAIDTKYAAGDFERLADGRIKFRIDSLAVTCKNMPGAVALLSAKYRRGLPAGFGNGKAGR